MLTRENFNEVILSIGDKDKKRILSSNKEYVLLRLNIFNAGFSLNVTLTDKFKETVDPEYLLCIDEVRRTLINQ